MPASDGRLRAELRGLDAGSLWGEFFPAGVLDRRDRWSPSAGRPAWSVATARSLSTADLISRSLQERSARLVA